ncbi:MAG: ABC transporter permease [Sphaerobacter sp.]|nr:ABC transporter permease [Sphaerobacter sp.]
MGTYVVRRILASFFVIFGLITVVFFLMRLLPGDPVSLMMTEFAAAAEDMERIREQLGLNDPILVQYVRYLGNLVQGDLGESVFTHRAVSAQVLSQLPATLELAVASTLIGVVFGVVTGIFAAAWRDSIFDRLSMLVSLFFISMPSFWVGLLFIYVFALHLGWFPVAGTGGLSHLVLPAVALGMRPIAVLSRVVRTSMLEVLRQDFVQTARAKGVLERRILFGHALRNVLIPVITLIGIQFGYALGGSVIIETVFGRQGIGQLAVGAVQKHDYPLVQGTVLFIGIVFVFANLIVDLLYGIIDPRIRYS